MQPERLPLAKVFTVPFLSLDGTSVEMASLIFLFLVVIAISAVKRRRQLVRRFVQAGSFLVFYFVVYSCLGVFGMIRNGLYGMTLLGSAYSESFYWLALPVVIISVTLLHGTVFCGCRGRCRQPWLRYCPRSRSWKIPAAVPMRHVRYRRAAASPSHPPCDWRRQAPWGLLAGLS